MLNLYTMKEKFIKKALNNLVSVKAGVFLISVGLLCWGKIDASNWVQVVGIVIGARTVNEVTSMVKGKLDE